MCGFKTLTQIQPIWLVHKTWNRCFSTPICNRSLSKWRVSSSPKLLEEKTHQILTRNDLLIDQITKAVAWYSEACQKEWLVYYWKTAFICCRRNPVYLVGVQKGFLHRVSYSWNHSLQHNVTKAISSFTFLKCTAPQLLIGRNDLTFSVTWCDETAWDYPSSFHIPSLFVIIYNNIRLYIQRASHRHFPWTIAGFLNFASTAYADRFDMQH